MNSVFVHIDGHDFDHAARHRVIQYHNTIMTRFISRVTKYVNERGMTVKNLPNMSSNYVRVFPLTNAMNIYDATE